MIRIYNINNNKFVSDYGTSYKLNSLSQSDILYNKIPTRELIFYNSFSNDSVIAETGQQLNISNSSYVTKNLLIDNIPCWKIRKYCYIDITESNINYAQQPITLSVWINLIGTDASWGRIISIGNYNQYKEFAISLFGNNGIYFTAGNGDSGNWISEYPVTSNKWYHVLGYTDGSKAYLYINGIYHNSVDLTADNNVAQEKRIRILGNSSKIIPDCYISCVRVYNRVLNENEIINLSKEFEI